MSYISNVQDTEEKVSYKIGFNRGLNTIQDPSLVQDQNLTTARNVSLVIDGVRRRQGSLRVFDQGGADYVWGSGAFYLQAANKREFVRIANGKLQVLDSAGEWQNVGSDSFEDAPTFFVQARDRLFIYNGIDQLRHYDGTNIVSYTPLPTPTNLAVAPVGATGSATYAYQVEAYNDVGRTAATSVVSISNGNALLSSTNYNRITWDNVTDAIGYHVFGRTTTGLGLAYLGTTTSTSFNDIGDEDPSLSLLPQSHNSTGGIVAKKAVFNAGRQFAIGITEGSTYYPTRIAYSGVLDNIGSFAGGGIGGGIAEIKANDGGEIVDLVPFENGVVVIKTNGIFRFFFSGGFPAIEEITTGFGGVSLRGSQVSDNDVLLLARKDNNLTCMVLGYQAQFMSGKLRANDLGLYVQDGLRDANMSEIYKASTWIYNNNFGFTYAPAGQEENSKGYVLDVRLGAFVEWDGDPMKCTHYTIYDDGSNAFLYGGSNNSGYMVRLYENIRNDTGVAYRSVVGTKQFNQDKFNVTKIYRNPTMWFKYVSSGSPKIEVRVDGSDLTGTVAISPSDSGTMVGEILAGEALAGASVHLMSQTDVTDDYPAELTFLVQARNIKFLVIDNDLNSDWLFMGVAIPYTMLDGKPLPQQFKFYLS
jgi:hypothetical protein